MAAAEAAPDPAEAPEVLGAKGPCSVGSALGQVLELLKLLAGKRGDFGDKGVQSRPEHVVVKQAQLGAGAENERVLVGLAHPQQALHDGAVLPVPQKEAEVEGV
eukprot:CAMPEP_0197491712 /NCGR_PEP_ID=MMETSP1311-20131121/5893_1 /TAXON_ID=464262 /ORGANISM="Genus nov. species nov., Strain RCC856" /LENGTH=103 /DNA_ID=CAMNT_0043036413 /DNA_START=411 /DNA_END=723 /DNA_ORIENTATION=-